MDDVWQLPVGALMGEGDPELLERKLRVAVAQPNRDEVGIPLPQPDVADLRWHDGAVEPSRGVEGQRVHAEHPPAEASGIAPLTVDHRALGEPLRRDLGCRRQRRFHGNERSGSDDGLRPRWPVGASHRPASRQPDGDLVVRGDDQPGAAVKLDRHRCDPDHFSLPPVVVDGPQPSTTTLSRLGRARRRLVEPSGPRRRAARTGAKRVVYGTASRSNQCARSCPRSAISGRPDPRSRATR